MINELKNANFFHKDDVVFKKYFNKDQRSENEKKKIKELTALLVDFYQVIYDKEIDYISLAMFNNDFRTYGYLDNYGYYTVSYNDKNYYSVEHYDDIYSAFVAIIRQILNKKSKNFEKKYHDELKHQFKNRFGKIKYIPTLAQYEYELAKWARYFKNNIPENIINMYNESINNMYEVRIYDMQLSYDSESKKFISVAKQKTKKRK